MKVSRFKKYLTVGAVIGLAGAAFAGISLDETIKNFLANYDSLTASMNYDLYKNEKARCPVINEQQDSSQAACRTAENKEFFQIGTEVLVAQFKQSGKWIIPDTPPIDSLGRNTPARVFHAKQHACLTATVKVMPSKDRVASDSDLKSNSGLYANNTQEPISYKAVIRFSSGQGRVYSDWLPDVKGMAIKVFNVKDEVTGEVKDADLLMTSGPNPLGRNLRDFADFMNAAVNGPLHAKSYISSHQDKTPKVTSINVGESLAAMRFWSGHPYLLGNISNRSQDTSMKFNVTSHSENGTKQITFLNRLSSENFLREDLKQRLTKNGKLVYDLNLQLEKDEKTTPVENTLQEWKENDSPSFKVAEIVIEDQNFDQVDVDKVCDELSFTPGHYVSMNRPLSNMGRGRIVAYFASRFGRGGKQNSDSSIYDKLVTLNQKKK